MRQVTILEVGTYTIDSEGRIERYPAGDPLNLEVPMAKKPTKKRRPTDATMRNVQASHKALADIRLEIRVLRARISHLEDRMDGVG